MKKIVLSLLMFSLSLPLQAEEHKGKVLVIMSNAATLTLKDGKKAETGFFLNEFAVPVQEIMDAGYEVVVATPQGKKPQMDKDSQNAQFFDNDKEKLEKAVKLADKVLAKKNIQKLSNVADNNLKGYAGVFIPGGHAPLVDLMVDPSVGKILAYFHENHKPTAMICHGPIAALSTLENPAAFRKQLIKGEKDQAEKLAQGWIYNGYNMTIFSTDEEKEAEKHKLKGNVEFYPEDALKTAGANIKNGNAQENNVIEDRELITGQNPNSDSEIAKTFIQAMNKQGNN
jgi:putative intracellular protease/amidase